MTPKSLRLLSVEIGRNPAGVTGQLDDHAEAWALDLADVENFRKLARGYMDQRDAALVELAALRSRLRPGG